MRISFTCAGIVLFASICLAATIHVPGNFPTIQAAINAAAAGDTVIVGPGTYAENIDFLGKAITVRSRAGALDTVIEGALTGAGVTFQSREGRASVLDAFTIRNGLPGVRCIDAGPTITNNIIEHCQGGEGGGISCELSNAVIRDNIIRDCRANGGWYDAEGGGFYCLNSDITLTGNTIINNRVSSLYVSTFGGGVAILNSSAIVVDNVIAENYAWYGHYYFWGESFGGGLFIEESTVTVSRNRIFYNNAVSDFQVTRGGGIYCVASQGVIEGNTIDMNMADYGGGCYLDGSITFANNIVSGNIADRGSGIYCAGAAPEITSCLIIGNWPISLSAPGGGIHGTNQFPTITNTIIRGNLQEQTYAIFRVDYCNVEGGWGWSGTGNIDADPLFADPAIEDYHLTSQSPCLDAGGNGAVSSLFDNEGDPRIVGTVDIGPDEYYYHLYALGDALPGSQIDIKIVGRPGDPALLALGTGIQDPPQSTPHGDLWLTLPPAKTWKLGSIPSDGIVAMPASVPSGWVSGSRYPFQALVGFWGAGTTKLTNPLMLEVQ